MIPIPAMRVTQPNPTPMNIYSFMRVGYFRVNVAVLVTAPDLTQGVLHINTALTELGAPPMQPSEYRKVKCYPIENFTAVLQNNDLHLSAKEV